MTTTSTRGTRALRAAVLPLVVGATVGLTACGGDSGGPSTTAAVSNAARQGGYGQDGARGGRGGFGAQTPEERKTLQACLKKQGVTLPTGRGSGGPGGAPPTGTDGTPPTGTDGTPPTGADGGPPAGGDGTGAPGGGLPGGGRAGGRGGAGMTAAERTKLQAALKSCGVSTPAGAGARAGGGAGRGRPDVTSAAYRKSIEAYVACVKQHGFDLPKPNFTGDGPIFDPKEVDQDDATFQKASAACQSTLRPQTSGGDSGSGSTSSSGSSGAQS